MAEQNSRTDDFRSRNTVFFPGTCLYIGSLSIPFLKDCIIDRLLQGFEEEPSNPVALVSPHPHLILHRQRDGAGAELRRG